MFTPLHNQRGQAMMAVGIGLLAFLGLTALAVDVGHMAFTATEVQTVADAAATAAAARFSVDEGEAVAFQNSVAGNPGPNACVPDDPLVSSTCIEFGIWDGTQFTQNDLAHNAAQATVRVAGVPNIVAGIFGLGDSTVTKLAVAAVKPTLPLALGQGDTCGFSGGCDGPPITINLGSAFHTPDTGWSTFHPDAACEDTPDQCVLNEMPTECGFGALGLPMPVLEANVTSFTVNQSYEPRSSKALAFCVNTGIRTAFVVPYFDCQGNTAPTFGAVPVGFETITISNVTPPEEQTIDNIQMNVQLSCAAAPTQVVLVK